MGISEPLSKAEIQERERWEQRYGEPLKRDHVLGPDFVRIGDETYKVSDLREADRKHPQPASHPFKPHHYLVQKAMDDLKAYREKYPDRKLMR